MTKARNKANRLKNETSPYLRQHAHNPVDWYPWGDEALSRAKRENKPIFLSIGYSACHWCHVMERESFESADIAKLMNQWFINIKVDREERPDLDHIYMTAVQAMTHHGGWPMSVFLTPDLEPFYGGTYFPPEDRGGMPGFPKVLAGVAHAWKTRQNEVRQSAQQLVDALRQMDNSAANHAPEGLNHGLIDHGVARSREAFDGTYGGFGSAPKFFHTMDLRNCLRHYRRTGQETSLALVTTTLDQWARGGIYDQLGGGFHRYSTDREWLAPHFEKMLYDNALVTQTYLEAFRATGRVAYAHIARETLEYVLREMTSADGAFFSTQDADTEGEEGRFYVWTRDELLGLLSADVAEVFCRVFDVPAEGNWEGKIILRRMGSVANVARDLGRDQADVEADLDVARRKLLEARSRRTPPFRDEKILASWNGLMMETFAEAYATLGEERYLQAARKAADFLWDKLFHESEGVLLHVHKDGISRFPGFLDDYANVINGLIALYQADFDPRWIARARRLADSLLAQFWDEAHDHFYYTGDHHESLITRPRETHDGATPSGTSMAVTALLRLGNLVGEPRYLEHAEKTLRSQEPLMRHMPQAVGQLLVALDFYLSPPVQAYLAEGEDGETFDTFLEKLRRSFLPQVVLGVRRREQGEEAEAVLPPLKGKGPVNGRSALYLCRNFTCERPLTDPEAISEALHG